MTTEEIVGIAAGGTAGGSGLLYALFKIISWLIARYKEGKTKKEILSEAKEIGREIGEEIGEKVACKLDPKSCKRKKIKPRKS